MLYCSDWTHSWSWWMGRKVAPTESSRGQNGASTVLPFHDWGAGGGLVMGVPRKKESIRIWMACPWNPSRPEKVQFIPRLQQCAVVGSKPGHDQNTTVDCSFPILFPQLVAVP